MPIHYDHASSGGTEQMAARLERALPASLLAQFDIVATKVPTGLSARKQVLWVHDLPDDPQVKVLLADRKWDRIVFVSHWQWQAFKSAFPHLRWDQVRIVPNAIEPFPRHAKPLGGPNVVFFGVPRKGLDVAVQAFAQVADVWPQARLHCHSSFSLYGYPKENDALWLNRNPSVAEALAMHPQIVNHGFTPPEEMRLALRGYHVLLYPSTWPETSCLTLIEAMSAGLVCVHPDLGALPETSGGYTNQYHWIEGKEAFLKATVEALERALCGRCAVIAAKTFTDQTHNWALAQMDWIITLTEVLEETPK